MMLSQHSIKYILLSLSIVVIGYSIYLLYRDCMDTRSEISKLKEKVVILTETVDNISSVNSKNEDEELYENKGYEEEVFKTFIENSDHLKNLQELSSLSKIEEVENEEDFENEEDKEDFENEEDFEVNQLSENDITSLTENNLDKKEVDEEEEKITFLSEKSNKKKCNFEIQKGKNKGRTCKKNSLENKEFCKSHC